MNVMPETPTIEMIDAMIRVSHGEIFLNEYAPRDWRTRLAKAIFGNKLHILESINDILAFCFKGTVFDGKQTWGQTQGEWRARVPNEKDRNRESDTILYHSAMVKRALNQYVTFKSRTRFDWENLGFEPSSSDRKAQDVLIWAWKRCLEHELLVLGLEKEKQERLKNEELTRLGEHK